jgi:excisionase family DNA binding protein
LIIENGRFPRKSAFFHFIAAFNYGSRQVAAGNSSSQVVTKMRTTEENNLMTDEEAAAYLSITQRTLRLWRSTRGLPHLKLTSKIIRYRKTDLDGWLEQHHVAIGG